MPTISFVNSKGGVGKSTTALVIAQVLVHHSSTVTLIDADPNQPIDAWKSLDPNAVPKGLTVSAKVDENSILQEIDDASTRDAFVLVDLEGSKNVTVSYAIGRSDLVVIPVQGSQLDANQAADVITLIEREKRAYKKFIDYCILFTRTSVVRARDGKHVSEQFREAGIDVLRASMMQRSAFSSIFQIGGSIYDLTADEVSNPDKAISNAEAVADSLLDRLKKTEV